MTVRPYTSLGRVCAANEDPEFDDCTYVPQDRGTLCPQGDVSCLMTGPRPKGQNVKRGGLVDNPLILVGIAAVLVVLLKR